MAREQRRLAAIVSADVAGYSRLMGRDESGTLAALKELRREAVDPRIAKHNGRIVKTTGDGLLLEFASVVDAMRCVIEVQTAMAEETADVPEERRIAFRIGVNIGDIIIDGDDIFGDGVNVAARLQETASPGGLCISGRAHDDIRDRLNASFADMGEQTLKNIARPIRVWSWSPDGMPAASASPPMLALPDKPSIAVLPFQNISGDPEQEYFADGMVEDIITALSRFRSLFVIARNASFTYKGKAIDIRAVARELGVRYVLEGSVRKAGNRLRITGQLIDTTTLAHLWAERFDGPLDDVFSLQDRITASVVGALAPKLDQAEMERAKRKPVERLDAYDWFLRGLAKAYEIGSIGFSAWDAALPMFARAMELDSEFAPPFAMAARFYTTKKHHRPVTDNAADQAEVRRLASRVAVIGKDDPLALCWAGHALLIVCGDRDASRRMVDQAIALNPDLATCWQVMGSLSLCAGEHEAAIEQLRRALRFNPVGPDSNQIEQTMSAAYLFLGRYVEALNWANKALAHAPNWSIALQCAANANAMMDNRAEANELVARYRSLYPTLSARVLTEQYPFQPSDAAKWTAALCAAGFPE